MRFTLRVFVSRLLDGVFRKQREARLSEEIHAHLAELESEYRARGMSARDARAAARRAFGNLDAVRISHRDQRGFPALDSLTADVRFAARLLLKDRWFTAAAVLVLGLGLGVNTTIFTIINGMNFRDLPVDRPDQIVMIDSLELDGRRQNLSTSYADFRDWQSATRSFQAIAAYATSTMTVGDRDQPADRLAGTFVSSGLFRLLRVAPSLGRDFTTEDERVGAAPVAILAHHLWTERYGGDAGVLGRVIRVNGTPVTVVGIMAEGCRFPVRTDLWQPIGQFPGFANHTRKDRVFWIAGRLADGVGFDAGQAEMTAIAAGLASQYPDTNRAIGATVNRFTSAYTGAPPLVLAVAPIFVLLIACANAANMLLGRSVHRRREMAVRAALGASRSRILRQLLVESAMLSLGGGALGLLLAAAAMPVFAAETADLNLPYWVRFDFDARVFAFVAAICLGTAFLAGIAPAWHLAFSRTYDALGDAGRGVSGSRRVRRSAAALLVAELALTVVLLVGASLIIQTGFALYKADAILTGRNIIVAQLGVPAAKYQTAEQRRALHARLQAQLDGVARFASATVAGARPFVDSVGMRLTIEGTAEDVATAPGVQTVAVGDRYFETLGLRMIRGRAFDSRDGLPGQEAVIVNERFVARHFPGVDPIGRRIRLTETDAGAERGPALTIVGISPSVRQRPMNPAGAVAYVPLRARPGPFASILVRSNADRGETATLIRDQVRLVDPDLAAYNIEPVERLSEKSRWPRRVMSAVLGIFAAIATLLSVAGVYAVTAFGISRRTSEIGIRMALGARRFEIAWLLLRRTLVHIGAGAGLGLAGAMVAAHVLRAELIDTSPTDPFTVLGVLIGVAAVAAAGCLIPARRAMKLDPVAALRHQ